MPPIEKNPANDLIKISPFEVLPVSIDNSAYLRTIFIYLAEVVANQRGIPSENVLTEMEARCKYEREVVIESLPKII